MDLLIVYCNSSDTKKGKKLGGDEIQKFNFRKIKNHMISLFRSMHIQGRTRKSILGEKKSRKGNEKSIFYSLLSLYES